MAFGSFKQGGESAPMAEINMIPLIDVMLVLLVIFIITAPLLTHAVKIDLPKAASHPNLTRPDHIALSINAASELFWNGERIDRAQLTQRLAASAKQEPQPELHLRADKTTQYQILAEVMAAAGKAGLTRIGFVSDPNAN
ncbi:MAG: putative transport-related rane protein [Betaproteobacteria bacterium]|jgi:biopolymer transport protein ExbD|nr:putative transport-related rane protein [Betaproteobacteria bacterium]